MLEMAKVRTATLNTAWLEASEKKTKEMEERGPWTALTAPSMPTVAAKPSKEKRRRFMKLKRDKADALDICATDIRAYTQMWEGTVRFKPAILHQPTMYPATCNTTHIQTCRTATTMHLPSRTCALSAQVRNDGLN